MRRETTILIKHCLKCGNTQQHKGEKIARCNKCNSANLWGERVKNRANIKKRKV